MTRRVAVAESQFAEVNLYCNMYSFVDPEAGGCHEAVTDVGES